MDPPVTSFEAQLDQSLLAFRQQILEAVAAHPEARSNNSSPKWNRDRFDGIITLDSSLPVMSDTVSAHAMRTERTGRQVTVYTHDDPVYTRGLKDTKDARNRIHLRLGKGHEDLISAVQLHEAVEALGLTRYTVEEMSDFVGQVASYINLSFPESFHRREGFKKTGRAASWVWPTEDPSSETPVETESSPSVAAKSSLPVDVVPVKALQDLFVMTDEAGIAKRKIFDAATFKQYRAMREILLAGDANRLVAELTHVRINDLAAPPEKENNPLAFMEHVVTVVIIANAVTLSLMTDKEHRDWPGWVYVEFFFASFLLCEILIRMSMEGWKHYWSGRDAFWNIFDVLLAVVSWVDLLILQMELTSASFLRVCRLIRLVRVMRIFRLKVFKELRLMVKGLVAGLWTLSIAFVLLFSVLYMVSGFAAVFIGDDERTHALGLTENFHTIPDSMFTAFRCFTGDCNADDGRPMSSILAKEFGIVFQLCYVVSYMLVAMGIFNVILAVYVDITMKAAKETEVLTADQHARESIRIARTTRELLKKFAAFHKKFAAFHAQTQVGPQLTQELSNTDMKQTIDEDINEELSISKECFLMVIQDRSVQFLMDQLDLPPDRANLFDVIDADGSGALHVGELVHGLLKIRGDVKKSDTVAPLLATKAVQQMLQDMGEENKAQFQRLETALLDQLDTLRAPPSFPAVQTGKATATSVARVGRTALL